MKYFGVPNPPIPGRGRRKLQPSLFPFTVSAGGGGGADLPLIGEGLVTALIGKSIPKRNGGGKLAICALNSSFLGRQKKKKTQGREDTALN